MVSHCIDEEIEVQRNEASLAKVNHLASGWAEKDSTNVSYHHSLWCLQCGFCKLCHGNSNQSFWTWLLNLQTKPALLCILLQGQTGQVVSFPMKCYRLQGHEEGTALWQRGCHMTASTRSKSPAWGMAGEVLMSGPSWTREMSHPLHDHAGMWHHSGYKRMSGSIQILAPHLHQPFNYYVPQLSHLYNGHKNGT